MRFLQSLKERRLIQWTLAYLAGAWLVLEVFSTLQQGLGWSPRLFLLVLGTLALGLAVTVVLAWYHGEQGRQRVSGAELMIIAGLLMVAGLLVANLSPENGDAVGKEAEQPATADGVGAPVLGDLGQLSIAVLPFANRSGLEEDVYFVDGIHDEVLLQLGKIRSLQVKSLTSVLPYRDSPKNLRTIGEELGARFIVEGSVQRAGQSVRISARLVDARTDERLWSQSYDPDFTVENVLDVQREIAIQVATRLGAEVLPAERALLLVDPPENMTAYDRYLEGLVHVRALSVGVDDRVVSAEGAIARLSESVHADSSWAPPRAALGRVYHWIASGGTEPSVNYPKSQGALASALRIDSLNGLAWNSLAFVRHNWERDFVGSEDAYRRAFALGYPNPHGYGLLLVSWGRFDEAIASFERAATVDPRSAVIQWNRGFAFYCAGDYASAVASMEAARGMGGRTEPQPQLVKAYLKLGRMDEGLAELEALRRAGGTPTGTMALLYALADSAGRAETLLAEADAAAERIVYQSAAAALVLGQRDRALNYLDRLIVDRPDGMMSASPLYLRCEEELRSLDGDRRYDALLRRVGIPPESGATN